MPAVRRAVHLAYSLGHTATSGLDLRDDELAARAVHLARLLYRARPTDTESAGLLGLLLLSQARARSRVQSGGQQILLEHEDRTTWDEVMIAQGMRCTGFAMTAATAGPFALQAAIAAGHAKVSKFQGTDWSRIVELYGHLLALEPSPTIAIGRSLALSYLAGAEVGLADLGEVIAVGCLDGYC